MQVCSSHEEFLSDPVGRWLPLGSGLVWAYSPTLIGVSMWGRPGRSDSEAMVRAFAGYSRLAPRFDFIQDGRDVESVDPVALEVVVAWLRDHQDVLRDNVGRRVAVLPRGIPGLTVAGLQVALGIENQLAVADDAPTAFRMLSPEGGAAVCEEVERAIAQARRTTSLVVALRALLANARGALDLSAAARALSVSSRTLQRELAEAGVSFRDELANARFRFAEQMLRSDDKLSTIASELCLSEAALTQITRARTGLTPAELRRRLRSS